MQPDLIHNFSELIRVSLITGLRWTGLDWTHENVRNKLYQIAGLFRGGKFSRILHARAAPACPCMLVPFRGCGYKKCLLDGQLQDVSPGNYKTWTWTGLWTGLNYGLAH